MSKIKNQWKVFQSKADEYILLSDADTIKKISGDSASDIVNFLIEYQSELSYTESEVTDKTSHKSKSTSFQSENNDNQIYNWLVDNKFIGDDTKYSSFDLNIIGSFGKEENKLNDFTNYDSDSFNFKEVWNLSKDKGKISFNEDRFTLILGPNYYHQETIKKISEYQSTQKSDCLFVEFYASGIQLGPLMNSSKDTCCVNCIESRRLYSSSKPNVIIENLVSKSTQEVTESNVFNVGDITFNKVFVFNELKRILLRSRKDLYGRAIYLDFNSYQNEIFDVFKSPNCEYCNNLNLFNPLC